MKLCPESEPDMNSAPDFAGQPMTSRGECKATPDHRDLSEFLVPSLVSVSLELCNLTLSKVRSNWGWFSLTLGCFFLVFWINKNISTVLSPFVVLISFYFLLFSFVPKTSTLKWLFNLTCLKLIPEGNRVHFRLKVRLENILLDENFYVSHSTDFTA